MFSSSTLGLAKATTVSLGELIDSVVAFGGSTVNEDDSSGGKGTMGSGGGEVVALEDCETTGDENAKEGVLLAAVNGGRC